MAVNGLFVIREMFSGAAEEDDEIASREQFRGRMRSFAQSDPRQVVWSLTSFCWDKCVNGFTPLRIS